MSDPQTTPADAKEALDMLRDLYVRRDGNMRTCNAYPGRDCALRLCHRFGCRRANDILNAVVPRVPA